MRYRYLLLLLPFGLIACSTTSERGTLAELSNVDIELKDEEITDGLEKAMQSYREFLEKTPEGAMTPEAIRRIADLSIEKEYGYVEDESGTSGARGAGTATRKPIELEQPTTSSPAASGTGAASAGTAGTAGTGAIASVGSESEKDFEKRIAQGEKGEKTAGSRGLDAPLPEGSDDQLANANAEQAIVLYKKLLKDYPLYERNDQVLYQMSRAYEELGKTEAAMEVMNQFIKSYPNSKYMDEVQFRRAEYFFTRKKFLDAEEAYQSIVSMGSVSSYYELALYKLGWSFYKQELYEEALHKYFALFDHKLSIGYDFEQTEDKTEAKRIEDTFRVISLSFSNLGGPDSVVEYFENNGHRSYEDKVYSHLGEYYLTKRRYSDAAASYQAFVKLYPFHEVSPHFNMRMIEIYKKGGFGKLVIEAKKEFAKTYALDSEYWHHFDINTRSDVVGYLKENLKDLANHYHALYQDKRFEKDKAANYQEALLWYRNYLDSFPSEPESPAINYQMADLMLENKDFGAAAIAYENTAYNYPLHEKSSAAGYAAVYAYREYLKVVPQSQRPEVKQQIIKSSLKFADTYPEHEKVTIVLGAAADDLYEMKNYELAVKTAHKLIDNYPQADKELRRSAWLVVGHGSFDMKQFAAAENGYLNVLALTDESDKSRPGLIENLAASIYKQGEEANAVEDYKGAAEHFLRVGKLAPQSKIRPTAEYDAAAALIQLKDWDRAAEVLLAFRKNYPNHELQPEVTKKVAFVYRSAGKLELAAAEYERIETETSDEQVRRGALTIASELYQEIGAKEKELAVYRRYVGYFPHPVEQAIEIYSKMASVYESMGNREEQLAVLNKIVVADKSAGDERTDRTRYLAAQAALVLAEPLYDQFVAIKLVQPLKENLLKKKQQMKLATSAFSDLVKYEVADVTAAATYYLAEIYYHFSRALAESERPTNLNDLEMEQYELALEDQIYPFEEKAIDVHKKNIELLHAGIYSKWIDKSIGKLAVLFPALYARAEMTTGYVETIDSFRYMVREPKAVVVGGEAGAAGEQPGAAAVSGTESAAGADKATPAASAASASGAADDNVGAVPSTPAAVSETVPSSEGVSSEGAETASDVSTGTEPATESVQENAPAAEAVPVTEPAPAAASEPVAAPVPVEEAAPVAEPEQTSEPESIAEPMPAAEAAPAAESEPVAESAPEEEAAPVAEPESITEPMPAAPPAPAAEPTPAVEPETVVEPEAEPASVVESTPAGEPAPAAEPEAVTEPEAEPASVEAGAVNEAGAQADSTTEETSDGASSAQ